MDALNIASKSTTNHRNLQVFSCSLQDFLAGHLPYMGFRTETSPQKSANKKGSSTHWATRCKPSAPSSFCFSGFRSGFGEVEVVLEAPVRAEELQLHESEERTDEGEVDSWMGVSCVFFDIHPNKERHLIAPEGHDPKWLGRDAPMGIRNQCAMVKPPFR